MQSWARSWWRLEFQLIKYLVSALWTPTCLQPLRFLVQLSRPFRNCVMCALLFLIWVNGKPFSGRSKTYCFPISVWTALFALRLQVQLQTVTRKNIWTRSPCWKKCTASTLYNEAEWRCSTFWSRLHRSGLTQSKIEMESMVRMLFRIRLKMRGSGSSFPVASMKSQKNLLSSSKLIVCALAKSIGLLRQNMRKSVDGITSCAEQKPTLTWNKLCKVGSRPSSESARGRAKLHQPWKLKHVS